MKEDEKTRMFAGRIRPSFRLVHLSVHQRTFASRFPVKMLQLGHFILETGYFDLFRAVQVFVSKISLSTMLTMTCTLC